MWTAFVGVGIALILFCIYYNTGASMEDTPKPRFTKKGEPKLPIYLKIKIKSLAAEAAIIRQEELKWHGTSSARFNLHQHRVIDVRRESRAAQLAYGFLRGRAYRVMEAKAYDVPDWAKVQKIVERFCLGDKRDAIQKFAEWVEMAKVS
jgi:hypothetical protein